MSNYIQERYAPVLVGANATVPINSNTIGGFFCTATGTLTITVNQQDGQGGYTLISAVAVTAGTWYRLPFYIGKNGGTVTTASNATGVLAA